MSTPDLNLDPLREAQAVIEQYYEYKYPDEHAEERNAETMLKESIACALVSIAESLKRIVDEEVPSP